MAEVPGGGPVGGLPPRRLLLLYSVQRFGLFVATTVALAATGLRGLPLLAVAVLVSSVLSFFLFRRYRDALGRAAADRGRTRRERKQQVRARLDEPPD